MSIISSILGRLLIVNSLWICNIFRLDKDHYIVQVVILFHYFLLVVNLPFALNTQILFVHEISTLLGIYYGMLHLI